MTTEQAQAAEAPDAGAGDADAGQGDDTWDADAPTVTKVRIERDRAAKEAKKLRAELAEIKKTAKQATEEVALARGETSKVIESRDGEIASLSKQLADATGQIEAYNKADRQRRLLDAIATEYTVKDRVALEGALLVAAQRGMVDPHPEDPAAEFKATKKALAKLSPGLFDDTPADQGDPVPGPHTKPRRQPQTEEARDAAWEAETKGTPWAGQPRPR
jgi:hypothetical protein